MERGRSTGREGRSGEREKADEGLGNEKGRGGWVQAKRQKRRLDYTSPAARSLFGRNRFFITKSLAGLYTKLYIRRPL